MLACILSFGAVHAQSSDRSVDALSIDFRQIGAPLPPSLELQDRAGITYTVADITEDRYFFLVLFNPTCGHCVDLASLLMQHRAEFEDNTVMFVAGAEMVPYLGAFASESKWVDNAERFLGTASNELINAVYNFGSLPQVNIYDENHKLVRVLAGEVGIEDLRPYIK